MATRLPAAERRAQLVAAANRVFAERGLRGATTRAIAAEAGVAEALIYRHFPSKEALFAAAVEETSRHLVDGARAALESVDSDPAGALGALVAYARDRIERDHTLAKMVFIVSAELDDPAVRAAFLPMQEEALSVLADAIARWQRAGRLAGRMPPRAVAWLLLGTFQMIALMRLSGQLHELHAADAAKIVERVLGANAPAKARAAT
ncbi:MAG: TetR/AcrR family transcriptional regulator [Myxococcales bacterium]|nr:TetR/AcrR family transcriptional regulator [Myxococcales bacterium]MCB9531650.1 TetR/AcrR family transcriptional regulator [Myxococcales bacterium]MCB9534215.1 TetR/AcrR family transcriptional regulator [Myxococcales bacterium]